jgi:hypothetical protein
MRLAKFKLHAFAIAALVLCISAVFLLAGPKPAPTPVAGATAARSIQVVTATWGANCNADIARLRQTGTGDPNIPPPEPFGHNNALSALQAQCEGKPTCRVAVNNTLLGEDPFPACYKRLQLAYRCFQLDRLSMVEIDQGDLLMLDCQTPREAPDADANTR